jgi:glutaredoxin
MTIIRWILGKIILTLDALFAPRPVALPEEARGRMRENLRGLTIYQFETCPFCVKVRRYLRSVGAELPLLDAKREPYRGELLREGGKVQVPCLKIEEADGKARWLYESDDIIAFLKGRVEGSGSARIA